MHTLAAAVIVGALVGAPVTAYAASDGNYTPDDPSIATLAGSTVSTVCRSEQRWIDYRVQVTAPDDASVSGDAALALDLGDGTVSVPLGALEDGIAEGSVAWPDDGGAAEAAVVDGAVVDATVSVDPAVAAALVVPLTVPACDSALAAALPATGLASWVAPLGVLGAMLVALGVAVRTVRHRRAR